MTLYPSLPFPLCRLSTGLTCFSGPHLGYLSGSIIVTPLWLAFSFGANLLVHNRVPDAKKNSACISGTGRPLGALMLVRLGLIAFFVLVSGAEPNLSGELRRFPQPVAL